MEARQRKMPPLKRMRNVSGVNGSTELPPRRRSASPQDDMHPAVGIDDIAHLPHFQSNDRLLKRLLHLAPLEWTYGHKSREQKVTLDWE